jgi:hypothetical protein
MANNSTFGNFNGQTFKNSTEINNFFSQFGATTFVDWFNANISNLNPWKNDYLGNSTNYQIDKTNWTIFWNNIPLLFQRDTINLVEFLCLNSIVINETGGTFVSKRESVNSSKNPTSPGLAYEFNSSGGKASYNTLTGNLTAYQCFRDPNYIKVNSNKGLADVLKNTTDIRWQEQTFPLGFSGLSVEDETSATGKKNGFLIEADFFKFRGRGYIQITSRPNYKNLVNYVLSYSGTDNSVISIQTNWKKFGTSLDTILTCSTNNDWDTLFLNKNYSLALWSVGNYLLNHFKHPLPINPDASNSGLQASILNFGASISGGSNNGKYPKLFYERVIVQLDLVNSATAPTMMMPLVENNVVPSNEVSGRLERTSQDPNTQVQTTGQITTITNIFGPTIKPEPIIIDVV